MVGGEGWGHGWPPWAASPAKVSRPGGHASQQQVPDFPERVSHPPWLFLGQTQTASLCFHGPGHGDWPCPVWGLLASGHRAAESLGIKCFPLSFCWCLLLRLGAPLVLLGGQAVSEGSILGAGRVWPVGSGPGDVLDPTALLGQQRRKEEDPGTAEAGLSWLHGPPPREVASPSAPPAGRQEAPQGGRGALC